MYRFHAVLLYSAVGAASLNAQQGTTHAALPPSEIMQSALTSPLLPWSASFPTLPAAIFAPGTVPLAAPAPGAAITLSTNVNVHAKDDTGLTPQPVSTVEFTGQQVLESAGTWSDLPRFLQTLPGLIGGSDTQNASFVRGGNSFENLFIVDRIEVPNINQLALANSTGGLGSMLDTEMIGNVSFQDGDIGSSYDSHLSSLTDVRTLELPDHNVTAVDLGYSGVGFRTNRAIGGNKNLLLSARESVTNLFLKDVGLNGSPEFTNALIKYTVDFSSRDHVWVDSLSGRDRLQVRPTWNDVWETNAYNTDYSGWRNTTGFVWQHTLKNDAVSTWTLSNSQNVQNLSQQSQLAETPSSFTQNNSDGVTALKYEYQYADENGSGSHFGFDTHQNRIDYNTAQSGDIYSPYSASTAPTPAFSLTPSFSTIDRAAFMDVNQSIHQRLYIRSGVRFQSSGLATAKDSTNALLPHGSASFVAGRVNLRASYSRSAQLPPFATIAGAPGNTALGLIHAQQVGAGGSVRFNDLLSFNVEAYQKTYTGYPVSTLYPQVSLATLLPTITEPFVSLTMQSTGKGRTHGVEASITQAPRHGIFTRANVTLSKAEFTGADGIYRTGTNDLPFVANVLAGAQIKRYTLTVRQTTTSGRPYTPVLPQASYDQDRSIYDLTQLNALRGPLYSRLDFALNRELTFRNGVMWIHAGLLNVLNRQNLFEYQWRPRCPSCGPLAQYQTGLRPDMNLSYTF